MSKVKFVLLAAGIAFVLAFALSCSFDDGEGHSQNGNYGEMGISSNSSSSVTTKEHYGKKKAVWRDERDGREYAYVTIGSQIWMAENLNYDTENLDSRCYEDDPGNCAEYGRLYNWATAKTACPKGWYLPSYEEWEDLRRFIGYYPGIKLKARSGWNDSKGILGVPYNGTDDYGFSALPGGGYNSDIYSYAISGFSYIGDYGIWWSATEASTDEAYYCTMRNTSGGACGKYSHEKSFMFSVRCIQG